MTFLGQITFISIAIISLFLYGGQATDVQTLIDMSTREGAAFFSDVAVVQSEGTWNAPEALYFTDTHANCIRKWTSTDGLQDFAGDCNSHGGFRNGMGSHALFDMPRGISFHCLGFLAVSDSQNACIRRVSLAGDVSTLAGQCGSAGDQDGDASEALFSTAIEGIACLRNCSILVTDPSSRTVRIITPDGDCPHQDYDSQHDQAWRYKKPLIWTVFALGIVAALGAAGMLLKPRIAKSLYDRMSRKHAEVQEASHLAEAPVGDLLKGKSRTGRLASYDDSAYRHHHNSGLGVQDHEQAPLIVLESEDEEGGGSSTEETHALTDRAVSI